VSAGPGVLVVGECLVDLAPAAASATPPPDAGRPLIAMPGGSPANVAVGLARLGVRTAFGGRLSRHGFGPWLREHLRANGVDLTSSVDAPELPTLRSAGEVLISFDPNVRPWLVDDVGAYRRRLEDLVSNAHIVKASDEDIAVIYPGTDPAVVVDRWLAAGTDLVLVTEGGQGASAAHRTGARARCAPPEVTVVDTIGAGDSFTAGLLAYLAQEDLLTPAGTAGLSSAQLEAGLRQAVTASALTCTRAGADPPNQAQLAAFLAQ
jgi:fructokinase